MKQFIIPFICCILIIFAFDYQRETEIMNEQITIRDNYSVVLDSGINWGELKLEMYIYPADEDVTMTIYNPDSEAVFEDVIQAGHPIDDVFYLDAQKGIWLLELSAEEAVLSYQVRLTEMYMTGVREQSQLSHFMLTMLACFMVVFPIIGLELIIRVKKLKKLIEEEHDVDMFMETCEKLKESYFTSRLKNIYTMNIAVGHIYNGDYLMAKELLESIPRDKQGEVKIVRKWLKLYYINYISILLELNNITEAENLMKKKKEILDSSTSHKNDKFFTPYIKTALTIQKGEYSKAKDRLLALKSLAKRDEDKAGINYGLAKVYYKLGDSIKAREYLNKAKEFANFKGITNKIKNLENQIESSGINYEV